MRPPEALDPIRCRMQPAATPALPTARPTMDLLATAPRRPVTPARQPTQPMHPMPAPPDRAAASDVGAGGAATAAGAGRATRAAMDRPRAPATIRRAPAA